MSYGIILEHKGKEILRNSIAFDGKTTSFFQSRVAYEEATGRPFPKIDTVYANGSMVSSRPLGSQKTIVQNKGLLNQWTASFTDYPSYTRRDTTLGEMIPASLEITEEMRSHLNKMRISYYPESKQLSTKQLTPNNETDSEDFVIYPKGFALCLGIVTHSIFSSSPVFFVKFTKTCMKGNAIDFAPHRSIKDILKILKTHNEVFRYLSRKNGYCLGICPLSLLYIEDYVREVSNMTPRKLKGELACWEEALDLIAGINACAEEEDSFTDTPPVETVTAAEEAISRMKSLSIISEVITDFRDHGTIKMSEFHGVLYKLSEEGQKAVAEVKEKGFTPYHVIKSGPLYTVLYVGSDKDEWEDERYSQKNHGTLLAYVYNSEQPFCSELGYVTVAPSSGGVTRTA